MSAIDKLNPKQREAALHKDGSLLILAGAGSGKTSTMTHRIAHLIMDEGISPWNILAVTFTNKAAAEMRDRIEALIGGGLRMWMLTFHSACLRILRRDAVRLGGYTNDFVVYDPTDQKVVVKACVREANLDEKKFTPPYVLEMISSNKERGKTAKDFAEELSGGVDSRLRRDLARLYTAYEKTLKRNNAMDFDDLLMNTVFLFERFPDILEEYRDRFRYIMVDEYQDTNRIQYRFVKMLAEKHGNICVVGDDDQCIYQWRGADLSNILDFEKDFKNAKVIKLEQNYRSTGNILNGANSVVANNRSRKRKKLWTDQGAGEKIRYVSVYDEKEEARFVAREIIKGIDEGRNYREHAVLYRTNVQSRTFEEAFASYSIPYQVLGGLRYYDRKEIKDMLSYMRLVQNPADDVSLARIINEPKRGIGAKAFARLTELSAEHDMGIFKLLERGDGLEELSAKAKIAAAAFIEAVSEYSMRRGSMKISDIYDGLLVRSGYLKALEDARTVEAESRIENLLEFKSVILEYEQEEPEMGLAEFLEKITLIADVDNHDRSENAVTLMTLHSAKGLEFPVVFMPGMEEGLFPGARASESPGGLEEERRLCYVGMTRAMARLYMIRAEARTLYGRYSSTLESRFLREIDADCLEGGECLGRDTTDFFHRPMGARDGYGSAEAPRPFGNAWNNGGSYGAAEVIRPFDQLKQLKENVARVSGMSEIADEDFINGDKVRHIKFGEGIVLASDAKTVSVMFDVVGLKKLGRGAAPIKKMD